MSKYLSHLMWLYLTIDVSLSERVFIEKHIGNIREAVYSETPSKIHRAKSYKSTEYILPPIPKIRLGPACVYNAECPECLKPLTLRCIANRCQCIYMRNLFTSILNATIEMRYTTDLIAYEDGTQILSLFILTNQETSVSRNILLRLNSLTVEIVTLLRV